MIKSRDSLTNFCSTIYRYNKVILKCKKIGDTIEIIHFCNLGIIGNGKIALQKLIEYGKKAGYKQIILEVYHYTDSTGKTLMNHKLIHYYYYCLGFKIIETNRCDVKMRRCLNV